MLKSRAPGFGHEARRIGVLLCLGLCACGRLQFEPTPPGPDASADSGRTDASADAASDAARDGQLDANVLADAETDAPNDAATDAAHDAAAADAETDAGVDAGPPRDLDFCAEIPRLRAAPTIDGIVEPGLRMRALTPVGWTAASPLPTDQPSSYAVAWHADGLYFIVKVVDPSRLPAFVSDPPWTGDGAEIYVDSDGVFANAPMYDPDTLQLCTAAPSDDVTPIARAETYRDTALVGSWPDGSFNAFPTTDGYVLEAIVRASDLMLASWTPMLGGRVGFNLSINVSVPELPDTDAGGFQPRLGQYFLQVSDQPHTCAGRPYCQPLSFCTPLLID